jgi:diaminopimelate epimerase
MRIPFVKMHGAANDFVVVDHRAPFLPEPAEELFRRMCDRRRGIGADGVLLLERDAKLDFAMRYHNADGGAAAYCGNGARCLARFALGLGLGRRDRVRFRTAVGPQSAHARKDGGIEVRFGRVERAGGLDTVTAAGRSFTGRVVPVGVPHFVVGVPDVAAVRVATWGAAVRGHRDFAPAGTNVDFVAPAGPGVLALRTFERGVEAETLACGSGAMAAALWAEREGWGSPVRVLTAGGDTLVVEFAPAREGFDVSLAGPAEIAYHGVWETE